jgi:predicted DNA-binding protein
MDKQIGLRVDEKLYEKVKKYSWLHKMTISEYVRQCIERQIKEDETLYKDVEKILEEKNKKP